MWLKWVSTMYLSFWYNTIDLLIQFNWINLYLIKLVDIYLIVNELVNNTKMPIIKQCTVYKNKLQAEWFMIVNLLMI